MDFGQIVIVLISAAFGGAGAKVVDSLIARNRARIDSTAAIRQELRDEAEGLRLENHLLLNEKDEWRDKYFDTLQELHRKEIELQRIVLGLENDDG